MKEFYLKIADRLTSAVPQLRYVDLEKGQTDDPDRREGIDYPAALIDIEFPACQVRMTVRVVFEAVADQTSHITPHVWRERSLAILDTVQTVVNALQGFDCGFSSALSRTAQRAEQRDDELKVYRIAFTATFDEEFDTEL